MKPIDYLFITCSFALMQSIRGSDEIPTLKSACFRQPFKTQCMDGKRSQYTIRWHVMGSSCMSYPYGYCPENEVSHVTLTMRTRKACEDFCMKNDSLQENLSVIKPLVSETFQEVLQSDKLNTFFNYTCQRQEYISMCPRNIPSQFTFRWYYTKGVCLAYPYGFCEDNQHHDNQWTMKTKEACELICRLPSQQILRPVTPVYEYVSNLNDFSTLSFWPNNSSTHDSNVKKITSSELVTDQTLITPVHDIKYPSISLFEIVSPSSSADNFTSTILQTTLMTTEFNYQLSKKRFPLVQNEFVDFESNEVEPRFLESMLDDNKIDNRTFPIFTTLWNNFMNATESDDNFSSPSQVNLTLLQDEKMLEPFIKWINSTVQTAKFLNFNTLSPERPERGWSVEKRETFIQRIMQKVCAVVNCGKYFVQHDLNV